MNIPAVNSTINALSQSASPDAISLLVLKKAIALEGSSALQVLQAVPAPSNPEHLGNRIDTHA